MNPPEINLTTYHENACNQIKAHFGSDIEVVSAYPRFERRIPVTAITIELDGITPENPDDMGTEQFHAQLRFAANVFVSFLEDDAKLHVRRLTSRLVAYLHGKRFGCPVGPAKIIAANPDALDMPGRSGREGEAEDYEVWRVEWSHMAFIGQSVWPEAEALNVEVWSSANGGTHAPIQ